VREARDRSRGTLTQEIEDNRRKRGVTVLTPLARDMKEHAGGVDVADPKMTDLGKTKPGRVEKHHEHAVAQGHHSGENSEHLRDGQNHGKTRFTTAVGETLNQIRLIEDVGVEEPLFGKESPGPRRLSGTALCAGSADLPRYNPEMPTKVREAIRMIEADGSFHHLLGVRRRSASDVMRPSQLR